MSVKKLKASIEIVVPGNAPYSALMHLGGVVIRAGMNIMSRATSAHVALNGFEMFDHQYSDIVGIDDGYESNVSYQVVEVEADEHTA